jgi:DNA processing protein
VVVEAGTKSGALITAGLAAEMGRDVFAVPGSIFSPMSEGTNKLLRDGAKPVLGVTDILEEYMELYPQSIYNNQPENAFADKPDEAPVQLAIDQAAPAAHPAKKAQKNLTTAQNEVYQLLSGTPVHVDQLALMANLELRIVLGALTILEIQGLARSLPGRRFTAV